MNVKVFVPIRGMQEIVNDREPHSAHEHSYVQESDYYALREALEQIEKQVRGLSTGERKGYLLATVQRVRELAQRALTVGADDGSHG